MRNEIVNLLRSQVGYHEGRDPNGSWNNKQRYSEQTPGLQWSDGQPWCAVFEAWGAWREGFDTRWPMTASCATAVAWWQQRGRFTAFPVLGGPLYMGDQGQDHTGVVFAYDADWVWSVEGNTNDNGSFQGDGVYEHKRPRRGPGSPFGYGVPDYPEGSISADPRWGGQASASVPHPSVMPTVSLANLIDARRQDIPAPTGHTTHPADVLIVEKALNAEGLLHSGFVDGSWGTLTDTAYNAFRIRMGFTGAAAEGDPGRQSLTMLGNRHGFRVV
jgi:hypothetical protein